jgi:glucokinase
VDHAVSLRLGLDLGGTNIKAAVLDTGEGARDEAAVVAAGDEGGAPRVLATDSCPTGAGDGPEAVLSRVAELGRAVCEPFGAPASAGLALPGHFDAASGTGSLLPNLLGDWDGRPIAGPVGERLGLDVTLVNDVRALTLAELRLGAGRGARDLVCVALGTGVGGGVVIGGRLHLGLGHAGEIGHTTVDPDGPLCGCGNRGCLDRMASAQAIAEAAGHATVAEAAAAARAGDETARTAFARAGEHVGRVLAGAVVLLWPERVVVGGGVADAGELLLEPLRAELRRRACVAPEIPVVPAQLGPHAGAVGAALWGAERSPD